MRRIVVGCVAVLAIAVMATGIYGLVRGGAYAGFAAAPSKRPAPSRSSVLGGASGASDASAIESDFKANEKLAKSAPQQQVVNGWVAKDAPEAQLRQSDTLVNQNSAAGRLATENADLLAGRIDDLVGRMTSLAASLSLLLAAVCVSLLAVALGIVWPVVGSRVSASVVTDSEGEPAA